MMNNFIYLWSVKIWKRLAGQVSSSFSVYPGLPGTVVRTQTPSCGSTPSVSRDERRWRQWCCYMRSTLHIYFNWLPPRFTPSKGSFRYLETHWDEIPHPEEQGAADFQGAAEYLQAVWSLIQWWLSLLQQESRLSKTQTKKMKGCDCLSKLYPQNQSDLGHRSELGDFSPNPLDLYFYM